MAHGRCGARLDEKAPAQLGELDGIAVCLRLEQLERDAPLREHMLSGVQDTHAPATEHGQHAIAAADDASYTCGL